jgi:Heterokaryon incompatibility protein (HET)
MIQYGKKFFQNLIRLKPGDGITDELDDLDDSNEQVPLYVFEPLEDPDGIRVLDLHHTSGERIECTLREIGLYEGGYQALSYVWGSEERPFRAIIRDENDKVLGYVPLTLNLRRALIDLTNTNELDIKTFWIDQICINQENNDEKSLQVSLMGQIFMNADRVITYVGPAGSDELEQRGMELLVQIFNAFAPNLGPIFDAGGIRKAKALISTLPVPELPVEISSHIDKHEWDWLMELAFPEWTTRLWIVQEQLLNSETIIMRGPRRIDWLIIAATTIFFGLELLPPDLVMQFWTKNPHKPHFLHPITCAEVMIAMTVDRILNFHDIATFEPRRNLYKPSHSLLQNMALYDNHKCRNQRDHIYALLAVSSDTQQLSIKPDYSSTISDVYQAATICIIRQAKDLQFLREACHWGIKSNPTHPSWALHVPLPENLRSTQAFDSNVYTPHVKSQLCSPPRLESDNFTLTLKGRILDHIAHPGVPEYWKDTKPPTDQVDNELDEHDLVCTSQILFRLGVTTKNIAALFETMITDPNYSTALHEDSALSDMAFAFWCYYRLVFNSYKLLSQPDVIDPFVSMKAHILIEIMAPLFIPADKVQSYRPSDAMSQREIDIGSNSMGRIMSRGRSLCITKQNRLANCMHEVHKEDVIVAFEGASFLTVLRPVGEKYRLVGDAYVQGLMRGEGYEGFNPDEVDYDISLV